MCNRVTYTFTFTLLVSQDQYTFIHDAILESLMCGNTHIPAASLKKALKRLGDEDKKAERNGFETQFHVSLPWLFFCIAHVCT